MFFSNLNAKQYKNIIFINDYKYGYVFLKKIKKESVLSGLKKSLQGGFVYSRQ